MLISKKVMILSLLIFLSLGSFYGDDFLLKLFNISSYSSVKVDNKNTTITLEDLQNIDYGTANWVLTAKALSESHGQAAIELFKYYLDKNDNIQLQRWLAQAVKLNAIEELQALAWEYFLKDETKTTEIILTALPDKEKNFKNIDVLIMHASIDIERGNLTGLSQYIPNLRKHKEGQSFLRKLAKFHIITNDYIQEKNVKNCPVNIELIGTSVSDLIHLEELSNEFQSHPLNEFICISGIRYKPINELKCSVENNTPILCDESIWNNSADEISSNYLGVMLPKGGANVHYGILYFDQEDSLSIFTHELLHILGFVDEYPLTQSHTRCDETQDEMFAHNIAVLPGLYESKLSLTEALTEEAQAEQQAIRHEVLQHIPWAAFIADSTPILQRSTAGWRLGTPNQYKDKIGVYVSETCENSGVNAFKPLYKFTSMRSSDVHTPKLYENLLRNELTKFLMPSYHYNVALSLFKKGDTEFARTWLEKAASFEKEPIRRNKILYGEY